jgi:Zn-dependent protease
LTYFFFFLAIVPSIVLHEVSHGYVANLCGDPTAKESHRLTLNPLRHIDPFGTVLLPALLIISGLSGVRVRQAGAGQRLAAAQAPHPVALRVARRAPGQHSPVRFWASPSASSPIHVTS